MRIWRNVIFIVAMATVCRTVSSLELQHGRPAPTKGRRFLFTINQTSTINNMCSRFCPLVCTNGYVKSSQGCFLCQCVFISGTVVSKPIAVAQSFPSPYSSVNGGIFLDKPCNPAIRHCRLQCTIGFLEGTNGCQHCACKTTGTNITSTSLAPTTATKTETTSASITQIQTTVLRITTSRPTQKSTINQPSASHTTQSPVTPDGHFNDPCIPSQKTCDKHCGGQYIKGPGGCQYCLCATNIPTELPTTTPAPGPGKFAVQNATIPHYLDLSPTSEACIMAKVICNQKCEHGFVSHPDDCLFCSCRQPNDVAAYDDPDSFFVTFPNPCVQTRATCGIMCLHGYVMGPRDCEFCSCR